MRPIGIGLAGLGNVGSEVARLLCARREEFRRRTGAELRLAAVCERRRRAVLSLRLGKGVRRVSRWQDLLRVPEVEVVVELMGGEGAALALVLGALSSGRHVVTANKMLLSRHWDEVFKTARSKGRRVYFEASVAGGIPIIQAVREGLAANRIRSVLGIFNGTTNYVLSEMAHNGCPMPEALRRAQRLGLAERDPSLDMSGADTAHKVSVLASLLAGRWFPPERIPCEGIESVALEDIRFAISHLGRTARLVGKLAFDWDADPVRVEAHVRPTLVPLAHPLANVHGAYNAVLVDTSSAGDLMFYGQGAGPGPAASAVLGDLLQLGRELSSRSSAAARPTERCREEVPPPMPWGRPRAAPPSLPLRQAPESDAAHYVRLQLADKPGMLAQVAGALGRAGISISQIHQDKPKDPKRPVPVMIATHSAPAESLRRSLAAIAQLPGVRGRPVCLRML
ncbi:MAG: homoserine dehydrogenase [Elusimicrobia bacterium]|nr:homoserine dehydrogenase [Elusimicrobiota bacterium]